MKWLIVILVVLSQVTTVVSQETTWIDVADGVSFRTELVTPSFTGVEFRMIMVRLDPAEVEFRVHYTPHEFHTIGDWEYMLDDPLVVINANFFTAFGLANGLVVVEGEEFGRSYRGYGGMFQVEGDDVQVRSLIAEPYRGGNLDFAAQGFPLFIAPGGEPARTGRGFDTPARRTFVGQDTDGLIYFMVTGLEGSMTLREVQQWLLESEIDFDVAFGLDGGKSTAMIVTDEILVRAKNPLPIVIAVYDD